MKSNLKKMRVRICCLGLTSGDIPDGLEVADIAVVEEKDMVTHISSCLVAVREPWVAEVISSRIAWGWRQDKQIAHRYKTAAFFVADMSRGCVLSELEKLFGEPNYVFDEHFPVLQRR